MDIYRVSFFGHRVVEDGQSSVFQTSAESVEEYMEKEYVVDEVYIEF